MNRTSDYLLAQQAASGDRAARDLLVSRHYRSIERLCRRLCTDPARVDDVVQETFVALLRKLGDYRGTASFTTWAYMVARTHHGRAIRSDQRHRARADLFGRHIATTPPSNRDGDEFQSALLRGQVLAAMGQLSELDRAVLEHRDIRGDSASETAAALGLTVPAVKTRLHRARARMRQLLQTIHLQTIAA